jgi:dienelactone hydrolase
MRIRRQLVVALTALSLAAVIALGAMYAQLELPGPSGGHPVGRATYLWADDSRIDAMSGKPREVGIVAWYPAQPGSGVRADYVPDLEAVREGLVASGELSALEAAGLRVVRGHARQDAALALSPNPFPIVLFSPGNATNVEFYAAFAEELASHGYVVVGINHPYQVTAMLLSEGRVAVYAGDEAAGQQSRLDSAIQRVDERVRDLQFVTERLEATPEPLFAGRIDLSRVGAMGHSLGGVAAAEFCALPGSVVVACLNLDGVQAGGPFAVRPEPVPPAKPFMFLTKEATLHPALESLFERAGRRAVRVTLPEAQHDEFADGPMFRPAFTPFGASARDVVVVARGFARAFFDIHLRGVGDFDGIDAPTDVYVYVYPLKRPGATP